MDVSRLDRKATLRAAEARKKGAPTLKVRVAKAPVKKGENASSVPGERLQKILAAAGICSRRKAEELILLGHVKVNGQVVNTLGVKADPNTDFISVDDKVLDLGGVERHYYLLNKPRGYISSTTDPQGRPTVLDLIPVGDTRLYPVGRLDYASEGLLVLTNDGDVANQLMHPSTGVRRVYAVKVKGLVSDDQLRQLRRGVHLADGFVKPLRVRRGERLQHKSWIELELTEGKNLEVRRIFAVLGLEVDRLRRVAIGPFHIQMVPVGKFVRLNKRQIQEIFADAKALAEEVAGEDAED